MTNKIIIAGFGGQGILFLGKKIASAGMDKEYNVTWLPSYGPEQRGGTCNCSVILSDDDISSPIISTPDTLIAFNIQSYDKFMPRIAAGGKLFADSTLIEKRPDRKDIEAHFIPATELANELGMAKLVNVIMFGFFIRNTDIFDKDFIRSYLTDSLPSSKAALREANGKAFDIGYGYTE
ncbi:MAG: 2-oxoacid:acceptor oxidoreductase family protein [Clostridia bacterium]|nr:2-oxoacid:acceptor oxidoreductase family protein [Clostridia bacterium]